MTTLYRHIIFFVLLIASIDSLQSQTAQFNFTLINNESGNTKDYVARDFILLKTNFKYTATPGVSFKARIGNYPSLYKTNPTPGDVSPANNTGNPPQAGTFNANPDSNGFSGVLMPYNSGKTNAPGSNQGSGQIVAYNFPQLWFKTVPASNNLNGIYKWVDATTQKATLTICDNKGTSTGTEFITARNKINTYNFNPAIDLSVDSIRKIIVNRGSDLAQHTIIGVWGAYTDFSLDKFMFAVYGRKNEGVLFSKQQLVHTANNINANMSYGNGVMSGFVKSPIDSLKKFQEKSLRIGTFYRSLQPNTSIWGENKQSSIVLGSSFKRLNASDSTFNASWENFGRFKGFTPECLVFDRVLSPAECDRYESYLAIKYGITMPKTYLSSSGKTLWNFKQDSVYSNRITGYGKDDGYGLYQNISTTSYEEQPYVSYATENDSYYNGDSYCLSTPRRLLVMGFQPGSNVNNENYVLFGDNNDSLKADILIGDKKTLRRKWLVCSKIDQDNNFLSCSSSGVIITPSNFSLNINKPASTSGGYLYTSLPLKGVNGYFSWTSGALTSTIRIKFGLRNTNVTDSADCGYAITTAGKVYPIINGTEGLNSLITIKNGQRIEIEKNGNTLFMRVDGIRYQSTELSLTSTKKPQYGAIIFDANSAQYQMTNFRHGGFVATGNRVELSYLPLRASEFAPFKNGKTYLIVDRTGTGKFNGPIDTYLSDEVDSIRSKIIFNNVFWNTANNPTGRNIFTFGYLVAHQNAPIKENDQENTDSEDLNYCRIYYTDPHNLNSVTVKIQSTRPSPAIIMVYDMSGRQILRRNISESQATQYSEIKLPTSGVFIVKVITNQRYYSQKVISGE